MIDPFDSDRDTVLDDIAARWCNRQLDGDCEKLRTALDTLLSNHSNKTAIELEELAIDLMGRNGSLHNTSAGVILDMLGYFDGDKHPLLAAQTIRMTWQAGKRGFQFLPDPTATTEQDYSDCAEMLVLHLTDFGEINPRRLLTGDDLKFYDSLPDRFMVYRGAAGCSPNMVALGMCWTTSRDIAEWFAWRAAKDDAEPILLSAAIRKQTDVVTVFASEFEVVATPGKWRQLKLTHRQRLRSRPTPISFE